MVAARTASVFYLLLWLLAQYLVFMTCSIYTRISKHLESFRTFVSAIKAVIIIIIIVYYARKGSSSNKRQ